MDIVTTVDYDHNNPLLSFRPQHNKKFGSVLRLFYEDSCKWS